MVCGLGSKSVAPFPDATSEDCYGGKLPWRRYRRAQLAGTFKVLVQKVCLLCYHTFVTSPLKYAHGTIDKYLSAVRGKPEDHASFLKQRKRYIEHVAAQNCSYIEGLSKVTHGRGRCQVVTETKTAGHRKIVRMTFVAEDVFNEVYKDGPHEKRFGQLSSEKTNAGLEKKGYWCRGDFNSDLEGHELHEYYEDEAVQVVETKDSGEAVLSKDQ